MPPTPPLTILPPAAYARARDLLRGVAINHLFARAVLTQHCRGEVLADDPARPTTVYIRHPYGMSLLLGHATTARVDAPLLDAVLAHPRPTAEWLQVYPAAWTAPLEHRALAAAVELDPHCRLNFAFHEPRFRALQASRTRVPATLARVDATLFAVTRGSVVPHHFWDDATAFARAGGGYVVLVDGTPASIAFTSFRSDTELELGIETAAPHRGRGYALEACAALIEDCLAHGLTPVWACRESNTASRRLAERLGFEIVRRLPYYRVPPTGAEASARD